MVGAVKRKTRLAEKKHDRREAEEGSRAFPGPLPHSRCDERVISCVHLGRNESFFSKLETFCLTTRQSVGFLNEDGLKPHRLVG